METTNTTAADSAAVMVTTYDWRSYYDEAREKRASDWDRAEDCYLKAIRLAPDKAPAHFYLGRLRDENGDKEGALEDYRRFLELGGEDGDDWVKTRVKQLGG